MLDIIWIIIASALILLMQAGFICLETGLVRSKNSINVAIKNLMDFCLCSAIFWAVGYGIMFGSSINGLTGSSDFFFTGELDPKKLAFFVFQMMFCGTAITIISGAVAERMSFRGYMLVATITSILIYPVIGHWAWAGLLEGKPIGWLGKLGFIDFAGSTVVHSVGGWVALAAIIIIGPRAGRFDAAGGKIQGNNLPFSVLGVILLWFGWFGFNAGSTLAISDNIPLIVVNTCLAAVFGGLSAIIFQCRFRYTVDVVSGINGVLGGLVAITAGCHLLSPIATVCLAIIAGMLVIIGSNLLERFQIDDVIGVVPVHLFCGIWGTFALVFFSDVESWNTGLNFVEQFKVQVLGIASIGLYSFCTSYFCLKILNYYVPLRVSLEAELIGLNISEHHAITETLELLNQMNIHSQKGDFRKHVYVEPFTEAGQIAKQYNLVLSQVNNEIRQREVAIDSFKASESRRDAILSTSLDCIVTIDRQGLILEFNPAAEKCFGFSRKRVLGKSFIEYFVPIDQQKDFIKNMDQSFSVDSNLTLNKHNKLVLLRIHSIEFNAELAITKVNFKSLSIKEFNLHIRDITQQIKLQRKMAELAFHDPLTGLYNRSYFIKKLQQEIDLAARFGTTLTLMFLDLDQFKGINDNLGHKAGDAVIQVVSERLTSIARQDDLICRWGGDEFIVLFPDLANRVAISNKADEILTVIRQPYSYEETELAIRTSIGITTSTRNNIKQEHLIQQADMAMYAAKREGRNTFCFFAKEMEENANKRFYFEADLRIALEQNQFFMVYQPKVDCQNNSIRSLEALLRWNHPKEGLISPTEFIPILEESTLMEEVTQWVLETVCKQIAEWKQQKISGFYVAINISGRDFLADDFDQKINKFLQQYKIEGHFLELEITETTLANNSKKCLMSMYKIKKLGLRLAIDDFGTGYSSMSYLKQFPINTLKIDKTFIGYCDSKIEDSAICTAIISLAKSLDLQIVAEGVEKDSQLKFLTKMECDLYQGYLFSKPLSANEIQALLKTSEST